MICALPYTTNRRHFKKLTNEATVAFFDNMIAHISLLNDLKQQVRDKTIYQADLIHHLDRMLEQKACGFVRVIYENQLFCGPNKDILLNEEPFEDFQRRRVFAINPIAKVYQSDQIWLDYWDKYLMMTKEMVLNSLRNTSR